MDRIGRFAPGAIAEMTVAAAPDAENRPTYIGLANTIPGIIAAVASLIGGWLVGVASYQAMFILSAIIGVICWALLRFAVREPRKINPSPC